MLKSLVQKKMKIAQWFTAKEVNMVNDDARKQELIHELAIATAKGDEDRMQDLAIELYEVYGWCGTPYFK